MYSLYETRIEMKILKRFGDYVKVDGSKIDALFFFIENINVKLSISIFTQYSLTAVQALAIPIKSPLY